MITDPKLFENKVLEDVNNRATIRKIYTTNYSTWTLQFLQYMCFTPQSVQRQLLAYGHLSKTIGKQDLSSYQQSADVGTWYLSNHQMNFG